MGGPLDRGDQIRSDAFVEMLDAARSGDQQAWTRLYRSFASDVLSYLSSQGVRDAENVLGDVVLDVARNLRTFQGNEPQLRGWVFTVAHHRVIDQRRYWSRRPEDSMPDPDPDRAAPSAEEEALIDVGTARVVEMLDHLTDEQRDVLLLRMVADLSLEQTAAVVNKRTGAVKALQHRALGSLRRLLDKGAVSL